MLSFCVLCVLSWGWPASADEFAAQGRQVLEKNKESVITVRLVLKMSMGGMGMGSDQEQKSEITGTVIDPSGLTVVSLTAIDPGSLFSRLAGMMGGSDQFSIETEVTNVELLLDDGSELPAQVVLRDKDLDLAFLRPTEAPKSPLQALDLANAGEAQVLDQVFTINQLGKVAGRAHAIAVERIEAIVEKPRKLYVPGKDPTHTSLGSPAFTLDGKVVGLNVVRTIQSSGGGMSLFGGGDENTMAIILPAGDVSEIAAQAPAVEKVSEEAPVQEQETAEQPAGAS